MPDIIHIRELLIKAHFGELTPEESVELEALLAAHEEARQIRDEISMLPREEMAAMLDRLDPEEAWQKVLEKEEELRRHKTVRRRNLVIGSAVAASVMLAAIFLLPPIKQRSVDLAGISASGTGTPGEQATLQLANGKVIVLHDSGQQVLSLGNAQLSNTNRVLKMAALAGDADLEASGWNTITVPNRLDYRIELPDGSVVWLNSTTKFRFPLSFRGRKSREVYIEAGEAYFQVAQQAEAPFVVHTSEADVHVLGTEFNVNAYQAGQVVTSLVNGKVAVSAGGGKRKELKPNQEAVVKEKADNIMVQPFDLSTTVSWREGIHYFRNAPVSEIAVMLSRWFNTELVIDNPEIAKVQFRGRLDRNRPLSEFVELMNLTKDANFYWKDGVLHCK
ncbi:FecR domain-containing protein [Chitinophaga sp. XS-30]|uniref:FecR domain-containing protein n=1 Tax=Chitinophaga sp. XS-30 TaxID=2604421 RepID=UPI0011DD4777|nr:FecR domain-containing protein [Chitinophaga sp. XS-30]QEH43188.1 DUF4974 domain-containing protein [Chitinophaga sp. XS-30]